MIQELTLRNPGAISIAGSFFEFVRSFFAWWYGDVPLAIFALLRRTIVILNDMTSFGVIVKGFFRPWKNDYNIAGWLVGMVIKTSYLPLILILFIATFVLFFAILLAQLAIMPVVIGLILINPFLNP